MCGICGVAWADPTRPVDPEPLAAMTDAMTHRGPDGGGIDRRPGLGLGVRRLAIIDPPGGDQPIASEDGSVVVVCNGEIYDAPETRTRLQERGHRFRSGSDVEVLVHLYEEHGPDFVAHLRGMFAFALWDERRRRLVLGRDRLGIKPLYLAWVEDGLVFASEVKALLASGLLEPEMDRRALADLFTYSLARTPRTLLRGVRRLPPGEILVLEDGRAKHHRYWSIDFPDAGEWERRTPAAWADLLAGMLDEVVRLHLRSDVPVGAWLSGGLDSSAVTALAGRATGGRIDAWIVGFEDPRIDESRGRTLADAPGAPVDLHRVWCGAGDLQRLPGAVWHVETPGTNGIDIPRLQVSEATARGVKVTLSGEGADELLGGYPWYGVDRALRATAWMPDFVRRPLARRMSGEAWPWLAPLLDLPDRMDGRRYGAMVGPRNRVPLDELLVDGRGSLPSSTRTDDEAPDALPPGVDPDRYERWHPFNRLQAWELGVRLPDEILPRVDHASMAYGLEARVPFLDHQLVELCARMPPGIKRARGVGKRVLRRAVSDVLPREIAWRRKRGLQAPHAAWLRSELPAFARRLLSGTEVEAKGYFRADTVTALLDRHRVGEGDHADVLLGVLSVHLWDEMFVRGRGPASLEDEAGATA